MRSSESAAAESSPYQARVIAAGAPFTAVQARISIPRIRCTQGDTVEVYREKPGGWLAIRPPVGSYSWVAERDLMLKDGGLAEVVKDDVASRIGSRLNDRHNAAQVRLKKGEGVEVLGEENISGEKWCKIAPPAGEFRWIQAAVVERTGSDSSFVVTNYRTNRLPNVKHNPTNIRHSPSDDAGLDCPERIWGTTAASCYKTFDPSTAATPTCCQQPLRAPHRPRQPPHPPLRTNHQRPKPLATCRMSWPPSSCGSHEWPQRRPTFGTPSGSSTTRRS